MIFASPRAYTSDFILQPNGVSAHFLESVRDYLNAELPGRCTGRAFGDDSLILSLPPNLPDLTPCDFFLWDYIKNLTYVPFCHVI